VLKNSLEGGRLVTMLADYLLRAIDQFLDLISGRSRQHID
jgi:hypothetical protein